MKNLFLFLIVLALLISSGFIASSEEWEFEPIEMWTTCDYTPSITGDLIVYGGKVDD